MGVDWTEVNYESPFTNFELTGNETGTTTSSERLDDSESESNESGSYVT